MPRDLFVILVYSVKRKWSTFPNLSHGVSDDKALACPVLLLCIKSHISSVVLLWLDLFCVILKLFPPTYFKPLPFFIINANFCLLNLIFKLWIGIVSVNPISSFLVWFSKIYTIVFTKKYIVASIKQGVS